MMADACQAPKYWQLQSFSAAHLESQHKKFFRLMLLNQCMQQFPGGAHFNCGLPSIVVCMFASCEYDCMSGQYLVKEQSGTSLCLPQPRCCLFPVAHALLSNFRRQEAVEDVPCGNTVAMVGLDQFITKNATLTNEKAEDAFPIKAMKFSVSPVVSSLLLLTLLTLQPHQHA